jgi:predicted NAD/FAD-binding protein
MRKKIAIIGTGISGLGVASLLHSHHDITVYEKNDYVGGHSRTVQVKTPDGLVPVDTGFIVFNKKNYPILTRLLNSLDVPLVESNMSFGVSIEQGWFEYGTRTLGGFITQKMNVMRPAFWKMLIDIIIFNARAKKYLDKDPSFTLADCLKELRVGRWFRDYYLLAMGGAIWSTPTDQILKFPACTFIRFFQNHGLLTIQDHPQWFTIKGGSQEYVSRLIRPFKDRIKTNCAVITVQRTEDHVYVEDVLGNICLFDDVIFACHADQALKMIADPSTDERRILSAFLYQPNLAILHSDTSFMPIRKKAWSSWVYLSEKKLDKNSSVSLSYWMNNLQSLKVQTPIIVTLNPGRYPDPSLIYDEYLFEHPVFDIAAIQEQSKIDMIQGNNRLWFCGAYQRYGFHEDGLSSAVKVACSMGIVPSW